MFIFFPARAGVRANEGAGSLAALASISDHTDITYNLRDIEKVEDFVGSEST